MIITNIELKHDSGMRVDVSEARIYIKKPSIRGEEQFLYLTSSELEWIVESVSKARGILETNVG